MTSAGYRGTLEMTSVFATFQNNEFLATNTIVGGTGDFEGAKGTLEFEGDTIGLGTYDGWIKTKPKKRRRARRH